MQHGNDHSKEKDRLRTESFTLHHRSNNSACPSLEMMEHGSIHVLGYALNFKRQFLDGIHGHRFRDWIKTHTLIILGVVLLIIGSAILVARREKVIVIEEVAVMLECPYCKNQWRESMSQTHLESMGYPHVRTLSRRKCSKCAKFIRPKIVATDVKS